MFRLLDPVVHTETLVKDMETFLKNTELYVDDRWAKASEKAESRGRLYRIFNEIFDEIASFELFKSRYIHGRYQDVHSLRSDHNLGLTKLHAKLPSYPDGVVLECDRCIRDCGFLCVQYCHVRTVIAIKTQADAGDDNISLHLAMYAREILAAQTGRAWVPSLLVTESQFRFFGFDRSGAWHSNWHDLHADAATFVLAVLVMFGCDSVVGHILPIERRGPSLLRKHANITFVAAPVNGTLVRAEGGTCWTNILPLMWRYTILGRGTICVGVEEVEMPDCLAEEARTTILSNPLLIKVYWKEAHRPPEWELLLKARGLPGVAQLIGYGVDDRKISAFRGAESEISQQFIDRTACHLLLEHYDGPLCCAPRPAQFFEALRDAVVGKDLSVHFPFSRWNIDDH